MQSKTLTVSNGETVLVQQQWAAVCEKRGTTVSTSAWEYSGTGGVSGETLVSPLATALLTATGSGELKNTATLANGEVVIAFRKVLVRHEPITGYV